MMLRSLLFVPGDSERKQAKGLGSAADALILDLEDSVAPAKLDAARTLVASVLSNTKDRTRQKLWVRVNPLSSGKLLDDLVAIMGGGPDGIMLPKAGTPHEVLEVHHYLTALEKRDGRERASTGLIVLATETPQAVLTLNSYVDGPVPVAAERLTGLTWGAEDLGAALGATAKFEEGGELTFTFQMARSLVLVTACACGVQPIDTVHPDFRDSEGLARESARARRDGFTGKMAVHPDQVDIINRAFSPTDAEITHARRIVAAFEANPDVGVTSVDGHMVDRPHLVQAQRVLAAASRLSR